jgi:hypothetical protein
MQTGVSRTEVSTGKKRAMSGRKMLHVFENQEAEVGASGREKSKERIVPE